MIADIQLEVYNSIYTACKSYDDKIVLSNGSPETTPSFPCVTFSEKINTTNEATIDTSGEYANDLMFEINIFSNSETPIAETNAIREVIDNIMSGTYRMKRTFSDQVENYKDTSIYRYILRYQCIVTKNKKIYRG